MAGDLLRLIAPDVDGGDVTFSGEGSLASAYRVTDLAAAVTAHAGLATRRLRDLIAGTRSTAPVVVDRRLASWWFGWSLHPTGWELPPVWDDLAGDYRASDGWVRLHTNAPHHRAAAIEALGGPTSRDEVTAAVGGARAGEVERAVVDAGGCAAAMRTAEDWAGHEQGVAVAAEPLLDRHDGGSAPARGAAPDPARPLAGVRVLDLTRVLAGPVATRFLAGLGADVLRLDPPGWDEPAVVPEVTLGKRCARLDLRDAAGRRTFVELLADADVLVHGYRPGALAGLGFDSDDLAARSPGLVEVSLDAYGWTGPWAGRRGFDSLVQMSCGIAATGMAARGADVPVPLPVQALDHATGLLLATAALDGWRERLEHGRGSCWRASLARTAALLTSAGAGSFDDGLAPTRDADLAPTIERTAWGPARRLRLPLEIPGVELRWDRPATPLGAHAPRW